MKAWKKIKLFVSLSFAISPAYLFMLLFSTLVQSGQILLNVILPKYLIDELLGAQNLSRLLLFGGLIVGTNLLFALLASINKRYLDVKNRYMAEMMQAKMADKIMNVSYACLETPYYLDLKERAVFSIRNQDSLMSFITAAGQVLKNLVTILGLVALMFTLSPLYVLVLLLLVGLALTISGRHYMAQMAFMLDIVPVNRKYGYYVGLCFNDKVQKDVRLYDMADLMTGKVDHYNREINREFTRFYRKNGRVLGLFGILTDLQTAIAYGYVGIRTFTDFLGARIGIGSFTMYVSAAIQFVRATTDLGNNVVQIVQTLGYLDPFAEFMTLPDEKDQGGTVPLMGEIDSIRFDHVTFCYPGSDVRVLDDVSFTIHRGEKISIVGLNGAGKTTLVKLLSRLYRPSSGTIYAAGRDIFEYDHEDYMKTLSAVFQDYKLLAYSIEENITGRPLGEGEAEALRVAGQVGLSEKLASLPDGIHTQLGKAYNEEGTEFSGGEEQKVAIARALYKGGQIIILDEPTSALDPLAEAEIYENFNALIGDKTAIYISHRMSSSVFCDRILIIDGGRVADYDTHAALMQKTDGLYYKLFMSQADNYRIEEAYS